MQLTSRIVRLIIRTMLQLLKNAVDESDDVINWITALIARRKNNVITDGCLVRTILMTENTGTLPLTCDCSPEDAAFSLALAGGSPGTAEEAAAFSIQTNKKD